MGVRLRPGNEGAFSRVKHIVVTPTKEIKPRQIQGKSYAHCIDGVVHREFVKPGQTVNGYFYVQVLQRLRCSSEQTARQVTGRVVSPSR
jgi:hypothetical protein